MSVDRRILAYLDANLPEYVPLVANRLGVHLDFAETRFERLVDEGMFTAVTNESIYTITDRGRAVLAGEETEDEETDSGTGRLLADD